MLECRSIPNWKGVPALKRHSLSAKPIARVSVIVSLFVFVLLTGCASTSKKSVDSSGAEDQLTSTFIDLAHQQIDQSNMIIDSEARQLLEDFIVRGCARMLEENPSDDTRRTAESNLTLFVDALIEEAVLTDEEVWVISEESFSNAMDRCPLWPFCE
jgi:hypothetical protein